VSVAATLANASMVDDLVRRGLVAQGGPMEAAFRAARRDLFLPGVALSDVYQPDRAVLTRQRDDGEGISSSSAPTIMAIMLGQLDVARGQRVLEVGAGTGYDAAILGLLVGAEGSVTSIDIDDDIVADARAHLDAAGMGPQVEVRVGDGWLGAPDRAPFDRIIVTVGVADLAPAWLSQLAPAGRLVAPLWLRAGLQLSLAFVPTATGARAVGAVPCGFMRLRGPNAVMPGHVVLDGGWATSADDPGSAEVALLRRLHAELVDTGPAPRAPAGWFARLALHGAAVRTWTTGAGTATRDGWLDAGEPSLALVGGGRLWTAGGSGATVRLLTFLADAAPLDLRTLVIDAVAPGAPVPPAAAVVVRPSFTYAVGPS
jgi:protein-L-isoaspartate(D-aspartate) O-methyltransferase